MRYLLAKCKKLADEVTYRAYLTDALRVIGENTAKSARGSYLRARWADIAHPPKEETRTADEIIARMKERIGGLANGRV